MLQNPIYNTVISVLDLANHRDGWTGPIRVLQSDLVPDLLTLEELCPAGNVVAGDPSPMLWESTHVDRLPWTFEEVVIWILDQGNEFPLLP